MALSDPRYLLFIAAATLCLALVAAGRRRELCLLAFSCFFLLLLEARWYIPFFVAGCAYLGGLALSRIEDGRFRDMGFVALLGVLFFPLAFYKYLPSLHFAVELGSGFDLILPIGISFYTFTAAGYLIDVYVEKIEAERRLLTFFNFILFFPNFSVGPIERAEHLIPQMSRVGSFDYRRTVSAMQLILLGYFYKVVIADTLAPYVDRVYASHQTHSAADLFLATVYFAFQVYADFAGYSLIAIGSARLLGIDLIPNFRQPYLSTTVAEFWRRWHISLSSWFRDYVFTPIHFRFRKRGRVGMAIALLTSFTLVGLWHGGGVQFLIFGLIHGTLVVSSSLSLEARNRFWAKYHMPDQILLLGRTLITFMIVCSTLVLFRAASMSDAISIYERVLDFGSGQRTLPLGLPLLAISASLACDVFAYKGLSIYAMSASLRWATYYAAIAIILGATVVHLSEGSSYAQQFIYFKF